MRREMRSHAKRPALIVGAPYGGVKEQGPCVYANELAQRFCAVPRGHHPNALGGFTMTSNLAMLNFPALAYITEIAPRPILFVVGDRAHSRAFSEKAYAAAAEPKELFVVDDAEHIDLYDRTDRIPFDKLEAFFKESLK